MATTIVTPTALQSNTGFTGSTGDVVADVQVAGSGDFISCAPQVDPASANIGYYCPDPSGITGPINFMELLVDAKYSTAASDGSHDIELFTFNPFIPSLTNTWTDVLATSYGMISHVFPHQIPTGFFPTTQLHLITPRASPGVTTNDLFADYVAISIDWTPPAPPADLVMLWVAPWFPTACGQPPIERFEPFMLIPVAELNPVDVSDLYRRKYGRPGPGYTLWGYSRSLSTSYWPALPSELFTLEIT